MTFESLINLRRNLASLGQKLTKIYLWQAQHKTSLHYQEIFEKSILIDSEVVIFGLGFFQ